MLPWGGCAVVDLCEPGNVRRRSVVSISGPARSAHVSCKACFCTDVHLAAAVDTLRYKPRLLVGSQCSGALILAKLGLLAGVPGCTDLTTRPWVLEAGVEVLNQPFFASGNVATAGGCLPSQYLAAWVIARTEGLDAARAALHYVAPVGEKENYIERATRNIAPYLAAP